MIQRSDEWFQARCGRVTASRIADVMARTKTGWGAGRKNYMAQLVAERLTGTVAESYTNAAMQHGTETEPQARAAYEFERDVEVVEVGSIEHPDITMASASPDGLVGDYGLIEIKCPNTATHIDTMLSGAIPKKYKLQMAWQAICTGRKWCDFVSFDPRMPAELQLFIKRYEPTEAEKEEITKAVVEFLAELDDMVNQLKTLNEVAA